MNPIEMLKTEFDQHIDFREKRPGVYQVLAPLYHEDGDMLDIFIETRQVNDAPIIRITDHGLTLMRLSYSYEIDTPTKRKIFSKILSENEIAEENGRLFLDTASTDIYPALLKFAQAIAKVGNMQAFKREVMQSLFYEHLDEFIETKLSKYRPVQSYLPIRDRDDLEVDWKLGSEQREVYLFGVKDTAKARLAALSCLQFQLTGLKFKSLIVFEDFETGLSQKDKTRITNAADKQFTSLDNFRDNAEKYLQREGVATVQ